MQYKISEMNSTFGYDIIVLGHSVNNASEN